MSRIAAASLAPVGSSPPLPPIGLITRVGVVEGVDPPGFAPGVAARAAIRRSPLAARCEGSAAG
jgi:hypothetical protein